MVMPASGPLNMGGTSSPVSVAQELGLSLTATISMNDAAVRTLAGVGGSGTTWSMNSLSGRSNSTPFFASRFNVITDGLTSNYANQGNAIGSWSYGGNNCDVVTITPNRNVILTGIGIGNRWSDPNSFNMILAVFNGPSTLSAPLVQETRLGVSLPINSGSFIVPLNNPVLLTAGQTYTVGFGWINGYTNGRTFYYSGGSRGSSTVTINGQSFTVTFGNATINSGAPFSSSNGTDINAGQCMVFSFSSTW